MVSLGVGVLSNGYMTQVGTRYKWTICNYTQCCKKIGNCITSPKFFSDSKAKFEWQLILNPKGESKSKEGSASLYLQSLNEFKVKAMYELWSLQKPIILSKFDRIFNPHERWGCSDFFIKEHNLVDQLKFFNDTLTIFCEILNVDILDSSDNQNENTKFNIIKDISKLFEEKTFSDVTIIVDKKKFLAHKSILAVRSEVFAAMFKNDFVEKQNNLVEINDTKPLIFEEFLRFIYTGEVKSLEMTAKDLLILADKYAVQELKNLCTYKLCKNINSDNVVNLLLYADLYNVKLLRDKAIAFITTHANNPTSLAAFHLLESRPQLLIELFFKVSSVYTIK